MTKRSRRAAAAPEEPAAPARSALPAQERDDLLTLAAFLALVPLVWLLFGWSWRLLVSGHDGLALGLVLQHELVAASGDWGRLLYDPRVLGGASLRDFVGPAPQYALLAKAGLGAVAGWNLAAFLHQALAGFLALRAAAALGQALAGKPVALGWPLRLCALLFVGFAPALGWRVAYGHMGIVIGALPVLAEAALLGAAGTGTLSLTLVAAASASFLMALLANTAQQALLSSVVFGAPLLLALAMAVRLDLRRALVPLAVPSGALLLALPGFWSMLEHARGPDNPRPLGGPVVAFDYLTVSAADLASSLPWTTESIPAGRADVQHEVNYPAGPLLLLLVALPGRRGALAAAALAAGAALAALFATAIPPFAGALLAAVPPLGSFRIPARALFPLALLLPVLALAAVLARRAEDRDDPKLALLALPALVVLWPLPPLVREAAAWLLAAALLATLLVPTRVKLPATTALLVLGGLSALAFQARLLPWVDATALLRRAAALGEATRRARPSLASGLERVSLGFDLRELGPNTAVAAGLPSLDGYLIPLRRYLELVFELNRWKYEPTAMNLRLTPDQRGFPVLQALYDVTVRVQLEEGRSLKVQPLSAPAGPAWIPAGLRRVDSLRVLADELRATGGAVAERVRGTLWLNTADPALAAAGLPGALDPACATARVSEAAWDGRAARARVEAAAACPLVFATNYAERLEATAIGADGQARAARVFPAYGALAAVWLPAGTREVKLAPRPHGLDATWVGVPAGLLLLAAALRASRITMAS